MTKYLRATSVPALFVALWNSCSTPPRDSTRAPVPAEGATAGSASGGRTQGEVEIGRVRDGFVLRGRTTPPIVRPGTEREEFLAAAARTLEVDVRSLDLAAPIVARYGSDELDVYEIVQRAEDIWRVQLLPPRIPIDEFGAALAPFATLGAIIDAAEAAVRRHGRG